MKGNMRYAHAMPFGASVLAGGGVRFTLWIWLCLSMDSKQPMPLTR
jgi:hypothetical protein